MPNLLELSAQHLNTRMKLDAGTEVTYVRKSIRFRITVVPGRPVNRFVEQDGVLVEVASRDFIVTLADLANNLSPAEPMRGDQIIQDVDNRQEVFVVLPDDLGTPPYEETDPYGVAVRVHTKRDRYA